MTYKLKKVDILSRDEHNIIDYLKSIEEWDDQSETDALEYIASYAYLTTDLLKTIQKLSRFLELSDRELIRVKSLYNQLKVDLKSLISQIENGIDSPKREG